MEQTDLDIQVDTVIHGEKHCSNRNSRPFSSSSSLVMFVIETKRMVKKRNILHFFFTIENDVLDEPRDDQHEAPKERPRLQLQPRTKPMELSQPLSGSSSSVNNVAANVNDSSISNADDTTSLTNTSGLLHDSSHEHRDDVQQHDSNEDSSVAKPSRGAGASIFGGAKPVDTAARELEIERKIKEMQIATAETATNEETEDKAAAAPQQRSKKTSNEFFI